MAPAARAWLVRLLVAGVVAASIWFGVVLLVITLLRLGYPFELEWMEGGMVDHGARVAAGQPLFAAPSVDFIPFIYPPLYSYLLGLGYAVFGVNLWWGRLLSLLATLCAAGIAWRWTWLETRKRLLALAASGLFLASYRACGAWFDLNRNDMLLLALLAGGTFLLRGPMSPPRLLASGLLLALAFFTKQFALVFLAGGALLAFARGHREGWIFSVAGFGSAALGTLLLVLLSDGWFWYYCFEVPFRNGMFWSLLQELWRYDVTRRFPFLLGGAAAVGLGWLLSQERVEPRQLSAILVATACGGATSVFGRIHFAGYDNTLIPLAFFTPIFMAVGVGRLLERAPGGPARQAITAAFCAVALLQFYAYDYAYAKQLPTRAHVESGNQFLKAVREIEGDVLIPHHGYYWSQTGKQMRFHVIGLHDEITHGAVDAAGRKVIVPDANRVPEEIATAFEEGRFAAVITDRGYYNGLIRPMLEKSYTRDPRFGTPEEPRFPSLPPPLTGMETRTGRPWTPRARTSQ